METEKTTSLDQATTAEPVKEASAEISSPETPPETPDEFEPIIDQTHFAEDVVIEDIQSNFSSKDAGQAKAVLSGPWWKSKQGIVGIVVGIVAVLAITSLLAASLSTQMSQNPEEIPQEQAKNEEQLNELQRQLLLLERDIEAADPIEAELAFPPVDYASTLEDALTIERLQELQQNRRR